MQNTIIMPSPKTCRTNEENKWHIYELSIPHPTFFQSSTSWTIENSHCADISAHNFLILRHYLTVCSLLLQLSEYIPTSLTMYFCLSCFSCFISAAWLVMKLSRLPTSLSLSSRQRCNERTCIANNFHLPCECKGWSSTIPYPPTDSRYISLLLVIPNYSK